jgi:hypothetical protein
MSPVALDPLAYGPGGYGYQPPMVGAVPFNPYASIMSGYPAAAPLLGAPMLGVGAPYLHPGLGMGMGGMGMMPYRSSRFFGGGYGGFRGRRSECSCLSCHSQTCRNLD